MLDENGDEVGRIDYDEFGNIISDSLSYTLTTRLYTNQRYEPAVNLYHYGSRFYDPTIGQFIQPDSIIPDPMNPLAWNRYAYVYQNPVNYVDPDGHNPLAWAVFRTVAPMLISGLAAGSWNVYIQDSPTVVDRVIDMEIGFAAGMAGYGIGYISPHSRAVGMATRILAFGALNVAENETTTLFHKGRFASGAERSTAFGIGLAGGAVGEGSGLFVGFLLKIFHPSTHLLIRSKLTDMERAGYMKGWNKGLFKWVKRPRHGGTWFNTKESIIPLGNRRYMTRKGVEIDVNLLEKSGMNRGIHPHYNLSWSNLGTVNAFRSTTAVGTAIALDTEWYQPFWEGLWR